MIPSTSKVASYIRNADEDANPTRQRDTITGWLARHHLQLTREYHDPGGRRHQLHDAQKRPNDTT
ncbi:MAG: hypothetical protein WB773_27235 [Isosphaeraceae bacterium]